MQLMTQNGLMNSGIIHCEGQKSTKLNIGSRNYVCMHPEADTRLLSEYA